jgi:RNA-directed DNA polymerase
MPSPSPNPSNVANYVLFAIRLTSSMSLCESLTGFSVPSRLNTVHHVLDLWIEQMAKPHCEGRIALYRFADDALIVCATERDARRIRATLPKRCAKYGLTLHPEKTRVLRFTRPLYPKEAQRLPQPEGKPETFEFLGFTHYWGRSQQGSWVVKRKTVAARFTRSLKRIAEWCREHRHYPVAWQHELGF